MFHCGSDDAVIVAYNQPFLERLCIDLVRNLDSKSKTLFTHNACENLGQNAHFGSANVA